MLADWLAHVTSLIGCSSQTSFHIDLVLAEAFTNIVDHAFDSQGGHMIQVSLNVENPTHIVIYLIDDGKQRYLKAENPNYEDIRPQGDWNIQGRVVGLTRNVVN